MTKIHELLKSAITELNMVSAISGLHAQVLTDMVSAITELHEQLETLCIEVETLKNESLVRSSIKTDETKV